jgi:phage-related protein
VPLDHSSAIVQATGTLHSTSSYIWLYEVQVSDSTAFRLAANYGDVTIYEGASSPYSAVTFQASSVEKPDIQKDNKGSLDRISIAVENVTLEVSSYLESNDLTDKRVRVLCVHSGNLGSTSVATPFVVSETYKVLSYEATNLVVKFELGHWSLYGKRIPQDRYLRTCRFKFRGPECGFYVDIDASSTPALQIMKDGYDLNLVSKDECDLGFETTNGCKAHGALEKATGSVVYHPRRFGGFPGLVKGQGF